MPGANKILPFAQGVGANALSDTEWEALTTLLDQGFQAGVAPSVQLNKAWRQSSVVSAALAQLIADNQANDITDSLTPAVLAGYMQTAINAAGITADVEDDSTKLSTTAWVRSAMSNIATAAGFAVSLGAGGYIKFPSWLGGLVMQWDYVTGTSGGTAVTFPIAFPTACDRIFLTSTAGGSSYGWTNAPVWSTTGYTAYSSGAIQAFNYLAIGR